MGGPSSTRSIARQACGELETGLAVASLGLGLMAPFLGSANEVFVSLQVGEVPAGWAGTVKANGVLNALTMNLQILMHLVHSIKYLFKDDGTIFCK